MYEPYYFGVIGPGFLNQVPTLGSRAFGFRVVTGVLRLRDEVQGEV